MVEALEAHGYTVVAVRSKQQAVHRLQTRKDWLGLVAISDWMMADAQGEPGLIELTKNKLPTISLITPTSRQETGYRYMDEIFFPPQHAYVGLPVDADTLVARMIKAGMVGNHLQ